MFYSSQFRMGRLLGADGSAKRFFTERWPSDRGHHAALHDIKIVAHTLIMLCPRKNTYITHGLLVSISSDKIFGAGRM